MSADRENQKCAFSPSLGHCLVDIQTMRWTCIVLLAFMSASLFAQTAKLGGGTRPSLAKAYGRLPLYFEKNVGQTAADVRFLARGAGYGLFLTPTEAVLDLRSSSTSGPGQGEYAKGINGSKISGSNDSKRSVVRIQFRGASEISQIGGVDQLDAKTNYFIGNDSEKWITGIPTFSRVQYSELYPGVGLVFYGIQGHLEYDLQLSPNADPSIIRICVAGAKALSLTKSGDLSISTEVGTLLLQRPNIYQFDGSERKQIRGEYVMRGSDEVGVKLGAYDKSKSLVIDPALIYSTYLGGTGQDSGLGGTVDAQGNAYVVGLTTSPDFPSTKTIGPAAPEGSQVAFVSKFNPGGTALVYSTFLSGGGNYGGSQANGIAVDANGFAYVTGNTTSQIFPVTASAYQSSPVQTAKRTVFVSKLSGDGQSLLYSTYLGGNGDQWSSKIAVDTHQVAYLGGAVPGGGSFPVTANAFQSTNRASNGNAFVSKIDTTQSGSSSLQYSTFLGGSTGNGSNGEALFGLSLDSNANVYVVGYTFSSDFPVTSSAYQSTSKAQSQMATSFLSRFDTTKTGTASLVYSTYFGGSAPSNAGQIGDEGNAVTTDTSGKVYVAGMTMSPDFPHTVGSPLVGGNQGFVSKFDLTKLNSASLIYSRIFGSPAGTVTGNSIGNTIGVDAGGNAYVAGTTTDPLFPVTADAVQSSLKSTAGNGFLTTFSSDASTIAYSTYFGSSNISPPEGFQLTPGTLTNVVSTNVVNGGPLSFFFTGWDYNSATGDVYATAWHSIGHATAIVHLVLNGSLFTVDAQCTFNYSGCNGATSPLNLDQASGLLSDPVDNTLLISGTVGSSTQSIKYDYSRSTIVATYSSGIVPNQVKNFTPGVQSSEKYMWTNGGSLQGTVYSAHDFSVVSTTNTGGYGTGTFGANEMEWDGGHYILGAGAGNGNNRQTASYDMNNVAFGGFTKLVDPNASGNDTEWAGNGLSMVPGASYALSNQSSAGFVDFYTFPQMSLIAHQTIASSEVVADSYNVAYVVNPTTFVVTRYDMTTGNSLGTLGTFTGLQQCCGTNWDVGVGILNHPVYGTWLVMHANGGIQGMFIRADVPYVPSSGDYINSLALDSANNIYIFGLTNGIDLPTSQQLFQPTQQGASDAFVAKFGGISTPTITGLTPSSGRVGSSLTILGANFGSSGTVTFNGVQASWSNWTANSIAVSVPSGAKTGNVVVTAGGVASNGVGFTVLSGSVPVVLVQHASLNGGTNSKAVLAFGGNNTFGNWIGVCVRASGTNQILSVSDTNGNLYRQAVSVNETGGGNTLAVFYAENIASGPNTVTVSDTVASSLEMVILEYSGLALYNSLDVTSSAIGNSTSPASGATTTTSSGDLLLGSIMSASGTTFTAGTGYTKEDNVPVAPSTQLIAEDEAQAQSGNASATATLAAGGYWAAALAAFKIGTITTGTTPTIAKITPVTGNVGTVVTVSGYNFGAVQGTIKFNGTTGTPSSWSDTSIAVPAPAGFTDGNIIVTVGGVSSNGIWFAQPLIASTSPSSGAVGSSITINGGHFGSSQGVVKFNGTPVTTYGSWAANAVAVTIPAGATAGPLVVLNSNGIVSNEYTFTVTGTVPSVTGISPTSGSSGTPVTISGFNFGASQGSSTVTFNGVPAGTATTWSTSSIRINAPSGATTGNVVVTVGGKFDLQTNIFSVTGTPSVSGISPSRGGVGVDVLITGSNLGSSGTVKFNGVTAAPWSWSSTLITVPVPPGATSGMITVTAGSTQIAAGTFDVRSAVPATATEFSYDAMGRVIQKTICTPMSCGTGATPQNLTATYDLGGDLMSVSYNGPIIGYPNVDALGRVTSVTSTWVDSQHPATLATVDPTNGYWPTGQLRKATLPNGLTESTVYNNRVQACRINVNSSGTLLSTCSDALPTGSKQDFNVGFNAGTGVNNPGTDNGNVATFVASGQQNFNRSYQYDKLNRIQSMSAPGDVCSGLSWTIDAWGNRTAQTATAGTCFQSSVAVNTANQLTGSPYQYDLAGNLLNDGNHTYAYDAEGRLSTVDGGQTAIYVYDAFGMRVAKYVGPADYEYVYDQDNKLIAEFNNGVFQRGYVYMGAQQLAEYFENTTYTVLSDYLGSTRLLGKLDQSMRESDDYYPFGELITTPSSGDILKFTGKERDSESGLDNFGARYDASSMGRFMSPDPSNLSVDFWIPQTWNRYAYALNNPLSIVDRNGMWPFYVHDEIIDEAFPGMSRQDLRILKDASWNMDYAKGQQSAERSFTHGMSDGGGTVFWGGGNEEHDMIQADQFITDQIQAAQKAQAEWIAQGHTGIAPAALKAFGNALHVVTDRTSPAHEGEQSWAGKPWWNYESIRHFFREAWPTDARRAASVSAAQDLFRKAFGNQFRWMLMRNDGACVTWSDSGGNSGGQCQK